MHTFAVAAAVTGHRRFHDPDVGALFTGRTGVLACRKGFCDKARVFKENACPGIDEGGSGEVGYRAGSRTRGGATQNWLRNTRTRGVTRK